MKAVAVDLGATSMRSVLGELVDGIVTMQTLEQTPNKQAGRCWDMESIVEFCKGACAIAENHNASIGIDSWGVDHGFVDKERNLVQAPVAYRDASHEAAFEALHEQRHELYRLTGVAHQPFNTSFQLFARGLENPGLKQSTNWLNIPDLIGLLLTGASRMELTQCSTTQLLGLDGAWSEEALSIVGWPVPECEPSRCGAVIGKCGTTPVVSVASHDTASAVLGLGVTGEGSAYLNIGTWSLLGVLREEPDTGARAEAGNWTNERAWDGKVRFLKNIPGLFVPNRLHEDLGCAGTVADWLGRAHLVEESFDIADPSLYNPKNMAEACRALIQNEPADASDWANIALSALATGIAKEVAELDQMVGRTDRWRIGGGGSQSSVLCQAIADLTGREVESGPAETTALGNILMQFLAFDAVAAESLTEVATRSSQTVTYSPRG